MKGKHPIEAEELQAYLDNELAAERRAAVEQHLAACVDCRRLADELRQVSTSLQAWQVEPAPVHLRPPAFEAAKQRLLTLAGERRRLTWKLAMAFGGVAATVLVIAAITLPNLLRSPEPLPRTESVPTPMYMPPPEREETLADREPQASVPVRKQAKPSEGLLGAKEHPEAEVEVLGEADEVAKLATREERGRVAMMAANKAAPRQMIAHEVSLRISVKDFDAAKQSLLAAVEQAGGYVAHSSAAETPGQPQHADFVVRVPVAQLATVLETLRGLGRVTHEEQSGEEVTAQYVDLEARLQNARVTEQRLVKVLAERTGKVKDILEVEREIARVREEIERMEVQRKHLENRVALATVQVTLSEEFEAKLAPAPAGTGTLLRNAFVDGWENFVGMLVGLVVFFARHGLNLLFWGVLVWLGWRSVGLRVVERFRPSI